MSTWTHVHGVIQIDIQLANNKDVSWLKKRLGSQKEDGYKKDENGEYIRITKMPMGSEGPIKYTITKMRDKHCLLINLVGYLRDFGKKDEYWDESDNTRYIEHWFRDLLDDMEEKYLWIRYAMLHYEAGDEDTGWMLHSVDGMDLHRREVIRVPVPKERVLRD